MPVGTHTHTRVHVCTRAHVHVHTMARLHSTVVPMRTRLIVLRFDGAMLHFGVHGSGSIYDHITVTAEPRTQNVLAHVIRHQSRDWLFTYGRGDKNRSRTSASTTHLRETMAHSVHIHTCACACGHARARALMHTHATDDCARTHTQPCATLLCGN